MSQTNREVDVVDVHVTSSSNVVDAFSQYPLLAGDRKYTVEITEFVCPLAGQGPLPPAQRIPTILEVRRKRLTGQNIGVLNQNSSLTTLLAPLGDPARGAPAPHVYAPGRFTDDVVQFKANSQRPMQTPGDLAYHLQRFFNDIRAKYISDTPGQMAAAQVAYQNQLDIVNDIASTQQEIDAAQLQIDGPNGNNGLYAAYIGFGPFRGEDHGGGDDIVISENTPFVTVNIQPNGHLNLFISPFFTKHFFITLSSYGSVLLGLARKDNIIAFRTDAGNILTGNIALTGLAEAGTIIVGESTETIQNTSEYSLERHFDHRVRLEVESQMGTPVTVAWTTSGQQKMSHMIATFPISTKTQTAIELNSEGVATQNVRYQTDVLLGDITWRSAESKVSERYLLNSSQYFHNIRLEVWIVRKEWHVLNNEFQFAKEKMVFQDGESWTAKLRFRSV